MSKLTFPQWPFPDQDGIIHWILSPKLYEDDEKRRQWMIEIAVRDFKNNIRFVPAQWGMISALRIGMLVVKGQVDLKAHSQVGTIEKFELPEGTTVNISNAIDLIPYNFYRLWERSIFFERCFKFETGEKTIVVPCIELIRKVFCLNKWLTQALMELDSFSNYVAGTLEGNTVKLGFTSKVSLTAIRNKKILALVARCLFDKTWGNSWNSVFIRRSEKGKSAKRIPLECNIPQELYKNSRWKVQGISQENTVFVTEILEIKPSVLYPYKKLSYSHPKLAFSSQKKSRSILKRKLPAAGPVDQNSYVDQTTKNSANTTSPLPIEITSNGIMYSNAVTITPEYTQNPLSSLGLGTTTSNIIKFSSKGDLISFNSEASPGQVQSAEFISWDEKQIYVPGFEKFSKAITELQKKVSALVRISYTNGLCPEKSFLRLYSKGHRYMLVKCLHPHQAAYIFEVEQIDGSGISTLVFTTTRKVEDIVVSLLNDYITQSRTWRKQELTKHRDMNIVFATHRSDDPGLWEDRFHKKLTMVTSIGNF